MGAGPRSDVATYGLGQSMSEMVQGLVLVIVELAADFDAVISAVF